MADDLRKQRGQVIAERCQLERHGARWFVPSQSSGGKHAVDFSNTDLPSCTCADWELRQMPCKHIHAVTFTVKRQQNQDGSTTTTATVTVTEPPKRRTYPQQWPAYNKAQTREKDKFQVLLSELCRGIVDTTPRTKGQARLRLPEAIFACCFKVYSTVSGRRFMSDLRDATRTAT